MQFRKVFNSVKTFFSTFTKSATSVVYDLAGRWGGLRSGAYQNEYRSWVYACITAAAERAASYKLRLYKKTKDGKSEEVVSHPAMDLFHDPNPEQTFRELLIHFFSNILIDGNAYFYLPGSLADGKKPIQIRSLNPASTELFLKLKPDLFGNLVDYYQHIGEAGESYNIPAENLIHFRTFNPKDKYRGIGVIQAAALAIDSNNAASEHNYKVLVNSGRISGVLSTDQRLVKETVDELADSWNGKYSGKDNAGKTAVLHSGLNYQQTGLSQKDLDYIEGKRMDRDEILAMFKTPKPVLGMTEGVSVSNADAVYRIYSETVIKPLHELFTSFLDEYYLHRFGLDNTIYYLKFDNCVEEDRELKLKEHDAASRNGWLTLNEIRAERGYPPVKGGDRVMVPFGMSELNAKPDKPDKEEPKKQLQTRATKKLSELSDEEFVENMVSYVEKNTRGYINKVRRPFTQILDELKKKLDKEGKSFENKEFELLLSDADSWPSIVIDILTEMSTRALIRGGKDGLKFVDSDEQFNVKSAEVIAWLRTNALNKASTIAKTLRNEVRAYIVQAADEGWGAAELANQLEAHFDGMLSWKAEMIARSELVDGYNKGAMEGYRQSNVVDQKKWLTSGFDQCDICKNNEDQGVIGLDDNFESGHTEPKAHPNCRCAVLPVRKN